MTKEIILLGFDFVRGCYESQRIVSPGLNTGTEILLNYRRHSCGLRFENLFVNQDVSRLMTFFLLHNYVSLLLICSSIQLNLQMKQTTEYCFTLI